MPEPAIRDLAVAALTQEAFAPFGTVIAPMADGTKFGPDDAALQLGAGTPRFYAMRLTDRGVGMHVGILPGYPASHGCVRLPEDIAALIYQKVKVGTPVVIE